jgi:flavin-dependent dehydrogenase
MITGPVIIGGGPAGAAAAILLARAGSAVTLIERNAAASDKVCGDFLSGEAVAMAATLGLNPADLAAQPITALRLVHGGRVARTRLPFPALGLTRRAFDAALLHRAEISGATILRGHAVRSLSREMGSFELECGRLGRVTSETVLLATGKHDLRGVKRPSGGPVALKMYYALHPAQRVALRGHVELVLFAGGYAGLQPVEAERAVVCVLVSRARLQTSGGSWSALLASLLHECPHLADRLAGAQPLLERPVTIAGMPYGYRHAPSADTPQGLFRLGDQAAVIASFTGDGVALALASASLAVRTWLQHGNAANLYHRRLAAGASRQMRLASAIHQLCLTPSAQPWLLRACRVCPATMRFAGSLTRVSGALTASRLTHTGYAP